MIDALISIPGPIFLFIYIIYSTIVIVLIRSYILRQSYSNEFEIPEPTCLPPLEIAIIKDGIKGAIVISLFNLWRHKAVEALKEGNSIILKQKWTDISKFNALESTIYKCIQEPTNYKDLFDKSMVEQFRTIIEPNLERINRVLNDDFDEHGYNEGLKMTLFGALFLIGFGGAKLFLGIIRNKPIMFLLFLIIISVFVLYIVVKRTYSDDSFIRDEFLQRAKQRFEWLKSSKNSDALLQDDNLLYGIAIFGASGLMGSEMTSWLDDIASFDLGPAGSFGRNIGGCSSGCSSCSGGCSGGGCGGCGGD